MATSGIPLITVTCGEIIQEALEQLGVLGEGETSTMDQDTTMLRSLNMMMLRFQAEGTNLFAISPLYLFLNPGQQLYTFTQVGITHALTRAGESFVQSTLDADALSGSTTITLTDNFSSALQTTGHDIGIYTTENEMFWTTISAKVDNTITLADPLPADCDAGALVYSLASATLTRKPMKILEAYHRYWNSDYDIPMTQIARRDYDELTNKATTGIPLQYYYDPQHQSGNLYVWPTGSDPRNIIVMKEQRVLDRGTVVDHEVEFPAEWFECLSSNLAFRTANKYGVDGTTYRQLKDQAMESREAMYGFDTEWGTSVFFSPDSRGLGGYR